MEALEAKARRGRPKQENSLTKENILQEAVALIDEIGLEQFSVRTLAKRLGVFPRAIYWHLSNKNALLSAVVNHCTQGVDPRTPPSDWKGWIAELLHSYRSVVRRHPRIAPLIASQLLSNRGADLMLADRLLGVLEGAGFIGEKLLSAFDVVIAAQLGFVTMEHAALPEDDYADWAESMRETVADIDETSYPHLARYRESLANRHFILRWENGITVPLDTSFNRYVFVVIQGLEHLLQAQ
ncbi:putative transcriptional regulator, TetR family [Gluconacetobacter liquefaciens]|uniref:TetR family transcriptional regulator n=1 Tax=Gluconacetobacter liquefaciens TaxID=89584 RepID=A0A370FXF3_GLULI|nr:TetR/AcrR family transcriptional regulator [Gluconacetobacter liquefaciens]MBB2188010.1 TetR/AcrR family transcriptional regulator [Gluconacetobacter liquefaciens]RDI36311.1 TetR family transcriptional regulator [Gluconacetobacter liquefaciens]GBQ96449.1 TetR family transcriptional regulator [Gluconacetobacter liquefaciens NRIC 0522]GEB39497.1 putative transcriptional regulator, TetR family [Gluconacetobacter liquefaciens]